MQYLQVLPVSGRRYKHRNTYVMRIPVGRYRDAMTVILPQVQCRTHVARHLL